MPSTECFIVYVVARPTISVRDTIKTLIETSSDLKQYLPNGLAKILSSFCADHKDFGIVLALFISAHAAVVVGDHYYHLKKLDGGNLALDLTPFIPEAVLYKFPLGITGLPVAKRRGTAVSLLSEMMNNSIPPLDVPVYTDQGKVPQTGFTYDNYIPHYHIKSYQTLFHGKYRAFGNNCLQFRDRFVAHLFKDDAHVSLFDPSRIALAKEFWTELRRLRKWLHDGGVAKLMETTLEEEEE